MCKNLLKQRQKVIFEYITDSNIIVKGEGTIVGYTTNDTSMVTLYIIEPIDSFEFPPTVEYNYSHFVLPSTMIKTI